MQQLYQTTSTAQNQLTKQPGLRNFYKQLVSSMQKQQSRKDFLDELRRQMLETQVDSGGNGLLKFENKGDYYLTQDGKLTDVFKVELQKLSDEQIKQLESKIVDLKPPQEDIFGIRRRLCQVCAKDCSGYQSANFLFASSTQQRGEFPTFCKQCNCPAYFHKVCNDQFLFPDQLADLVRSNNIQSNDINWNCLMSTFMLEVGTKSKITEVTELLKEEGIEVISYSQRHLQSEEAFLLRNRIVQVQFEDQSTAFNQNFTKISKDNEIRTNIQMDAMEVNMKREINPYFLEKQSQQKEALMKGQMLQSQRKTSSRMHTEVKLQSQNLQASLKPSLQGENMLQTVVEEGDEDFERDFSACKSARTEVQLVQDELQQQSRLLPLSARNARLMITKSQRTDQKTVGVSKEVIDERDQIAFLIDCYKKNPFLQQLCSNEIVFLILSSTSVKDLSQAVKKVMSKFDNTTGTRCLYFSQNKVQALEDCIQFVPHLFRLSKSIMVSEPLIKLHESRFNKDSYIGRLASADYQQAEPLKSTVTHYSNRQAASLQSKLSTINRLAAAKRKEEPIQNSRRGSVDSVDNISQESWVQRARGAVVAVQKQNALQNKNNKILFNFGIMRDFFNYSGMCVQLSHKSINFAKPPKPQGITGGQSGFTDLISDQPCNMFAIAKVGLPNLIMPNTLDLKFQNFENFDNYSRIADMFFPDLNVSSHTVIVLRPMIVRNELNNLVVNILRANEFLILKQVIRPLTAGETLYLFQQEQTSEENKALYFDLMMQGSCEILVVSKLSGVYDARTLFYGASPYGRRRMNVNNQDTTNTRAHTDSVSTMFEVAPFTSFTELIDLEDFLCRNSKLHKFQQENQGKQPRAFMAQADLEARERIKIFSRFFNFVGYCSPSIQQAQQDICTLTPEVAQLQEICLILNPIYNNIVEDAFELLIRQGFQIMQHKLHQLTEDQVKSIFSEKFDFQTPDGHTFMTQLTSQRCHVLHLIKLAADLETRQLYRCSDLQVDDFLNPTEFGRPLNPVYMPYIFLYLDTPEMFETGLSLLYKPEHLNVSGKQMFHHRQQDAMSILQMSLLVTIGDTVKVVTEEASNAKSIKPQSDQFEPLHPTNLLTRNKPQFQLQTLDDKNGKAEFCAYAVESQNLGIFEVRFITVDPDTQHDLLSNFTSLSHFYKEASKVSSNIVPACYFHKIAYNNNRVFEVEEYMGEKFIDKLARMHIAHEKIVKNNQLDNQQKSMPAFVFGTQISQLCRKLQTIQTSIKGAGKFTYDGDSFVGELPKVTQSNYFFYDKQRYTAYLATFKKAWLYYISSLEAEVIEMKLQIILNSLTFRYSRQPEFLKLVPERLTTEHFKISEKIKVVNLEAFQDDNLKFFKADGFCAIYPNREQEVSSKVESIMQTLKQHSSHKVQSAKDFSIHNDVTISGFHNGIARRPQTHLLASLLWILDFEYRKVNRCEKFFVGDREYKYAQSVVDKEYDEVLDIVMKACLLDYHQDHPEALDVMQLKSNEGAHKSDLQKTIEAKHRLQDSMLKQIQEKVEEEKRRARQTMSIAELIKTEIWDTADEAKKQQRTELKEFLTRKGGMDRDGNQFMQFMEKSKMQFGPYATKLAEQFIQQQSLQQLLQKNPQHKTQEFISFVKMEYFLYGVAEAHYVVSQLRAMEDKINDMDNAFQSLGSAINQIQNQITCLPYEAQFMQDRRILTQKMNDVVSQRTSVEDQIYRFRLEISTKEAELVMIFKELLSCDFYVCEDHFLTDLNSQLAFQIPLTTFWKEVKIEEYVEIDLNNQHYQKTVGAMPQLNVSNYGRFLAQSIRHAVIQEPGAQERISNLAQGTQTTNLHDPQIRAKPEKIAFEKFQSAAETLQARDLERQDAIIKAKQGKIEYKPDVFKQ